MAMPFGIDVSNHQGSIDWTSVRAAETEFAFIKSSEGVNFVDPYFPYNWSASKRVGIARGAYHFARPDLNGPVDEAQFFVRVVRDHDLEVGDMLVLDLERGSGNLSDWAYQFVSTVRDLVGFFPLVYTSPSFIVEHRLHLEPRLMECGLWLASWGSEFPEPVVPWDLVAFWQYTDSGSVPGIDGDVDCNRFNGPVEAIRAYGKPESIVVPDVFTYVLGFADLVNELGRDVVGDPIENEHDAITFGHTTRHQLTTRGELTYWPELNRCEFRSF